MIKIRKFKRLSTFIVINIISGVLVLTIGALLTLKNVGDIALKREQTHLEHCINTFWELLRQKGTDYHMADGKMLAGNYVINDNNELPDKIKSIFGGTATIFMGDTRIVTNVSKENGSRAIGTKLVGPAYDAVFKQGRSYRGETTILGVPYITAYDPIRDKRGGIIGVLYVGVKKSELLEQYEAIRIRIIEVAAVLIITFGGLALLLFMVMRRAEKLLSSRMKFLQTLIDAMPSPVFAKDEKGVYTLCNEAFASFVGLQHKDIVGRTVFEVAAPELAKIFYSADNALLEKGPGAVQKYEAQVAHAEGGIREVLFVKAVFAKEDGSVGGIVGTYIDITELMRAEEQLRKQKEFADKLLLGSAVPGFVLDPQHRVIGWNIACEELTGIKAQALLGTTEHWRAFYREKRYCLADYLIENSFADMEKGYPSVSRSALIPEGVHADGWYPALNGIDRFISFNAAPVKDSNGELLAVVQTFEDVTEYRQLLDALSKATESQKAILSNIPDMAWLKDNTSHFVLVNEPFAEACGRAASELVGKTDFDIWPLALAEHYVADDQDVIRRGQQKRVDERLITEDGRTLWIETTKTPVRNVDGKVIGTTGIARDITERKMVAEELTRTVSLLNATLEATGDGIMVVDLDDRVSACNQQFLSMWRMPDELLDNQDGKKFLDWIISQLSGPEKFIARLKTFRSNLAAEGRDLISLSDGRVFEYISKPQRTEIGITGRVCNFRDISQQKILEDALRQSQKMEAVGTLAGGIAHDFNNILTAITCYSTFVKDALDEGNPLIPHINQVLAASQKAAGLTHSLLAYSRKQVINKQPIELNDNIQQMNKFLSRLIGANIKLSTILDDRLLTVFADSGQIEQVLMNLVINARDAIASMQGEIIVTTELAEITEEFCAAHGFGVTGKYALLLVKDTGTGMSRDTVNHIFEPFFTTKEAGKGTGLGLSMVYGIVKQHDGFIDVESELGRGTIFKIYFPLFSMELLAASKEEPFPVAGGKETILLVEDGPEIRQLFRTILMDSGYTVIEASNGDEGLTLFHEHSGRIDLLLTDLIMPKKNGGELYEAISQLDASIKVLFISGYTSDILDQTGFERYAEKLLTKPFSPAVLLRRIRQHLDQ
jgi:two-component system NtrC family sensor kinase